MDFDMPTITGNSGATGLTQPVDTKGFDDLSSEDFVQLLITELSNQNPLDPSDNEKLLQQINSINQLAVNQQLVDSLQGLTLSQTLGSAGNLIGKQVAGTVDGETITGVVNKALVEDGSVLLSVQGTDANGDPTEITVPMNSVTEIGPAA